MPEFLALPVEDRREALAVADASGRPIHLLEKDVWVVWTLHDLFGSDHGKHLVFKGGTSLSKAYGVIRRFSEDVDLTYDIREIAGDLIGDSGSLLPRSNASPERPRFQRRIPRPRLHRPRRPYWDPRARGAMLGLTRGTSRAHIARAALESIAFQSAEVLEAMQKDSGTQLKELRVDGGAASNDLLMQFQADLLGVPVVRPKILETTALGAAYLAGLTVNLWKSREEIASHWKAEKRFEPHMGRDDAAEKMARWREAVSRSRNWAKPKSS